MALLTHLRHRLMGLLCLSLTVSVTAQERPLSMERFRELHAQLQPDPTDLWRTVPWKTSVLDGQQTAAVEGKPIFIWAMDGHPLGCT